MQRVLRIALPALGLIALVAGATIAARAPTTLASQPHLIDCGRGVPVEKCNQSLYSPPPGVSLELPTPAPRPPTPPDDLIPCGRAFFPSSTVDAVIAHFGGTDCFEVVGTGIWVLVSDGLPQAADGAAAAPGGAIVATLQCAATDGRCLDPNTAHDLAAFTVSYAPVPIGGRARLQEVERQRYLVISSGGCGLVAFDIVTGRWYSAAVPNLFERVAAADPSVVPLDVTGSQGATQALAHAAPVGAQACHMPAIGG